MRFKMSGECQTKNVNDYDGEVSMIDEWAQHETQRQTSKKQQLFFYKGKLNEIYCSFLSLKDESKTNLIMNMNVYYII